MRVFLSVKELELRKVRFDVAIPPGEIDFRDNGLKQTGPLEAHGQAELLGHTLGEIRVQGHLKIAMEADCDRCLEPAVFPVDTDFDLYYRPSAPESNNHHHPGEEVEIDEGEAEIGFYDGAGLELEDILREHILLSLPMQKVCREDCHGICPVCGRNRNLAECGCEVKAVDDRWSALKKLKMEGN